MLQNVITAQEARQITRGRTPLVPVEYETAVKSIAACLTLDEAKYWDAKADALAAWAKMYRSNELIVKAKQLKLHAYRRMGELAYEIRPKHGRVKGEGVGRIGSLPGPRSLLKDHGLSVSEVDSVCAIYNAPQKRFDQLLKNPVAPTTARSMLRGDDTPYREIMRGGMSMRSVCRRHTPAQVIATMTTLEIENGHAEELAIEVMEWMDEFAERIKAKRKKAA